MKMKFIFIIAFINMSCHILQKIPESKKNNVGLIYAIEKKLQTVQGDFAMAFKDLQNGETIFINSKEVFHAASTMKTPVMIEVFKQVSEGKFSLGDSIIIKNEFKSIVDGSTYHLDSTSDSQTELYKNIGKKATLYHLLYEMIIASSNLSTNLIIELVDAKKVTQTMRHLGAKDILVLRGVEDGKAYEKGLNNTTTAYDLLLMFEHIANETAVDKQASDQMIDILSDQKHNEIIPALLPKNIRVAHKTGSITGVQHDSGIIFLPDGRKYVLVLLSKNLKDEAAGVKVLAEVSRMVFDSVESHKL
jgi:beta-lactamase class A